MALVALALVSWGAGAQGFAGRIVGVDAAPVVGATVMELSTLTGAVSDAEGRFAIRFAGPYPARVVVRCVGYSPDTLSIPQRSLNLQIVLRAHSVEGEEVSVVGRRRAEAFESLDAGLAAEMASVEAGVGALLKSQMGVAANSELSSQYRVRGGNFDENLVYVNGVEIYRPFLVRAGEQEGLSFVNPDLVDELNFSSGGFDASFGDKMSSVLDVSYKRPTAFRSGARVSLLGAQAHAEGVGLAGKLTHVSGVRYKTNQYLFGSLDTQGDYQPSFFDAQTYWTLAPSPRTRIGVLAYYAQNTYRFRPTDRTTSFGTISDAKTLRIYFEGRERDRYRTCVVAADVRHELSETLTLGGVASMFRTEEEEKYDILGEYWLQQAMASQSGASVDQSQNIGVGGYMRHARNNLFGVVYSVAAKTGLRLPGRSLDVQLRLTREHYSDLTDEWAYTDSAGYVSSPSADGIHMDEFRQADNSLWQTRFEAYFNTKTYAIEMGRGSATFVFGSRVAYQNTGRDVVYGPRASFAYRVGNWRTRLAGGRYCQLPSLREMKRSDATLDRQVGPQKSWQVVGGVDLYFGSSVRPMKFTVEAYCKWLRHVNPYSIDNVRIRYEASNNARGYAAGLDFKLNGQLVEGAESWATLSIMKTAEDIEGDGHGWIPRPSDQRVQFSMMFQDHMPLNRSITGMLSLFFGSGLPFGPSGGERWQYTNRMPGYKRVDLGVYKDFAIRADGGRGGRLRSARLGVEVFNLFDFDNTISHFWVRDDDGRSYAVPNYLTGRRLNVKLSVEL